MKQNFSLAKLKKEAEELYKKDKEIVDIILFGSAVRGKSRPSDIDVLVLFNRKSTRVSIKNCTVINNAFKDFFSGFPAESVLGEGYSLIFGKKISELYGMSSAYIFRYSLKNKSKSRRMQFYYALYGRGTRGVIESTGSKKFSNETILTPIRNADQMKQFFDDNEIEYFFLPVLYPATYTSAEKLSVK
ncbi:MAG TPA: nucleotidyltransferase domain-containing protein [Candidatus Nanoarchaeia archaeon]|nr:nucleotidyltransferase domain-containing protein [Candidatus Nanoarchaeia archaeon]